MNKSGGDDPHHYKDSWSIDKRIPIVPVLALLAQTMVFIFWIGAVSQQVTINSETLRDRNNQSPRISVLEADVKHMNNNVNRLIIKLDKVLDQKILSNKEKS